MTNCIYCGQERIPSTSSTTGCCDGERWEQGFLPPFHPSIEIAKKWKEKIEKTKLENHQPKTSRTIWSAETVKPHMFTKVRTIQWEYGQVVKTEENILEGFRTDYGAVYAGGRWWTTFEPIILTVSYNRL